MTRIDPYPQGKVYLPTIQNRVPLTPAAHSIPTLQRQGQGANRQRRFDKTSWQKLIGNTEMRDDMRGLILIASLLSAFALGALATIMIVKLGPPAYYYGRAG